MYCILIVSKSAFYKKYTYTNEDQMIKEQKKGHANNIDIMILYSRLGLTVSTSTSNSTANPRHIITA